MSPAAPRPWLLALALLLATPACEPELDLPSPELELLFGKWQLVASRQTTDSAFRPRGQGQDNWQIEFLRLGIFRDFPDGELGEETRFEILPATATARFRIRFRNGLHTRRHLPQLDLLDLGPDSLQLREPCPTCPSLLYVRVLEED